jgi:hypothetical protein
MALEYMFLDSVFTPVIARARYMTPAARAVLLLDSIVRMV